MSYKCEKCGSIMILDGFVTMELGKCQSAFNKLQSNYDKLLQFIKEFHKDPSDEFIIKARNLLKGYGEIE